LVKGENKAAARTWLFVADEDEFRAVSERLIQQLREETLQLEENVLATDADKRKQHAISFAATLWKGE